MDTEELGRILKTEPVGHVWKERITSLEFDSRSCMRGSVYFAFPGLHAHGDVFSLDAIRHGACAIVTCKRHIELEDRATFFIVPESDVRRLYALSSARFFNEPSKRTRVIGVTGTDGKTSTSYYLWQLLTKLGLPCGLSSTVYTSSGRTLEENRSHNTTPEAFLTQALIARSVDNGAGHFVLESSSHALSDEYSRLEGTVFSSALYTSVTSEHLEFHHSLEAYWQSKLNLARKTEGPVLVYAENPLVPSLGEIAKDRLVLLEHPQITEQNADGLDFICCGRKAHLPFFAPFALDNAFLALMCASEESGISIPELLPLLSTLKNPEGRQEIFKSGGITVVVDFAHTANGIESILGAWRAVQKEGRFITVFGASGERDTSKRSGMGRAASAYSDLIILTEDDPRSESVEDICTQIARGIGRTEYRTIVHREDAVRAAISSAGPGDTVFLLGLGPQKTLAYDGYSRAYSDADYARSLLGEDGR